MEEVKEDRTAGSSTRLFNSHVTQLFYRDQGGGSLYDVRGGQRKWQLVESNKFQQDKLFISKIHVMDICMSGFDQGKSVQLTSAVTHIVVIYTHRQTKKNYILTYHLSSENQNR